MKITITSGKGEGSTQLSAFDAALFGAGIANYNLLRLSSVIPPKSKLVIDSFKNGEFGFGDRLYVVLAEKCESEMGREAWAGVGWVQAKDGRGLFVEHNGSSKNEVVRLIKESLSDMVKYRNESFGEIHYQVMGMRCEKKPVCVLVAAVYQNQGWGK